MLKSIILSIVLCLSLTFAHAADKQILKQTEMMTVEKSGLMFHARMDTGAVNSSLHAVDLTIIGGAAKKMKQNIGKTVEFTTENEKGEKKLFMSQFFIPPRSSKIIL